MTSRFASFDSVTHGSAFLDDVPGEVWIYTAQTKTLDDADTGLFAEWLDAVESARLARFTMCDAAVLFVAAHGLARFALSHWQHAHNPGTVIDPNRWSFRVGKYGKPEAYVQDCPDFSAPSFSLSHTRGATAVAVAGAGRIGVDIEWRDRQVKQFEIADRYFTSEEQLDILGMSTHGEAVERFLLYWTLKEAYLKALGFGLTKSLKSFAFKPEDDSASLLYDSDGPDGNWLFRHYRQPEGYILALARDVPAGGNFTDRIVF
jgi:Phosphopantetheinyl transferase